MNPPLDAAWRFLPAILLGCALGILYGFLRPLRQKSGWLPDLIFLAATLWVWTVLSFGICRGDLRPAYTLTLLLFALLWDRSLGRWLMPVFSAFWKGLFRGASRIFLPLKKFSAKCKFFAKRLFASGKKEGIINWNNRLHFRRRTGGNPHGK